AVSLWVAVADPAIEWPEWVQPSGSHDAYEKGAKVTHNGKRWTSSADGNVWEPGVYGWEEV
ncbi:MAG: chitinase, partial [Christensenellales bacterium]